MDFNRLARIFKSGSDTNSTCYPGTWRFPKNPRRCSIYRVPESLRRVNPEAYTPQLVIIGPLHHYLKIQALKSLGDVTNTKSMGYVNMEEHKKIYLTKFAQRVDGNETINELRRKIRQKERVIRESYSESTAWIQSSDFVEMIMYDSVFIVEFLLNCYEFIGRRRTGDPLTDEPCLEITIMSDLILLENQLPYFILHELFDPIIPIIIPNKTFRELIIMPFGFKDRIGDNSSFRHFTDLIRCVRVETLQGRGQSRSRPLDHIHNAAKLHSRGVNFKTTKEKFSIEVRFEKGCLSMPSIRFDDSLETTLRNVMALEQCHYPFTAHVCSYIMFLDYLIDTDKDVDLLVEKGIIKNWMGEPRMVAETVNKLGMGITDFGSYYSDVADGVNTYYSNSFNNSRAILKNNYFGNLWIGTATIAAMLLLLMTLIQTVAAIIQVLQNAKK